MVGCRGSQRDEVRPPRFERAKVAAPGRRIFAGQCAERLQILEEAGKFRIDDRIGAEGGQDPPLPSRVPDGSMVG